MFGESDFSDKLLDTNRLVEFEVGLMEILPHPTQIHQTILAELSFRLGDFIRMTADKSRLIMAPFALKLWEDKFRAPDLMVMLAGHATRRHEQFWEKPDIVVEIVSPDDPKRDLETKRREYALAGIPEYWLINPLDKVVLVLVLDGDRYVTHGDYREGDVAESLLLTGFSAEVSEIFNQPM